MSSREREASLVLDCRTIKKKSSKWHSRDLMCIVPVTDDSRTGQKFKDPQQLQPEKVPPFSTLLVL